MEGVGFFGNNEYNRFQRILHNALVTKLRSPKWLSFFQDVTYLFLQDYLVAKGVDERYYEWDYNVWKWVAFLFDEEKTRISPDELWYDLRPVLFAKSRLQCMRSMEILCNSYCVTDFENEQTCYMCRKICIQTGLCEWCREKLREEKVSFAEWRQRRTRKETSTFIAECAFFWLQRFLHRDVIPKISQFITHNAEENFRWDHVHKNGKWL
jgi:hypothetical protein